MPNFHLLANVFDKKLLRTIQAQGEFDILLFAHLNSCIVLFLYFFFLALPAAAEQLICHPICYYAHLNV